MSSAPCIPVLMALARAGLGRLQKLEPALVLGETTCLLIPRADCLVTKVANLSGVQKPPVPRAPPPSYHRRPPYSAPAQHHPPLRHPDSARASPVLPDGKLQSSAALGCRPAPSALKHTLQSEATQRAI